MVQKPRVREHVNPLAIQYQQPTTVPAWESIFAHWHQPLSLDLGCGQGEYLLAMAQQNPSWNYLGLEIRYPLVEYALSLKQLRGYSNLHFLFCNINTVLSSLFSQPKVHEVTIQFPDPWFKRRQQKRRLVQPALIHHLTSLLIPGAKVLVQSDVLDTAKDILLHFEHHGGFINLAGPAQWAESSLYPVHILTEREAWAIRKQRPIYRLYFCFKG